ncbi:MAG: hypothetical protein Kow0098_14790 [Ignavibacteriaceae bacterium]
MNKLLAAILILIVNISALKAQSSIEEDLNHTFQNAKKGIYWALSNIPENKSKTDNQLIADDKLVADVKLYKEINGIRIESTGYYNTHVVKIIFYRSEESLAADGYSDFEDKEK